MLVQDIIIKASMSVDVLITWKYVTSAGHTRASWSNDYCHPPPSTCANGGINCSPSMRGEQVKQLAGLLQRLPAYLVQFTSSHSPCKCHVYLVSGASPGADWCWAEAKMKCCCHWFLAQ